jgi:PDZ domain-containing secreted protein
MKNGKEMAKQEEIIEEAVKRTQGQRTTIQMEREEYQKELEKRLKEQEEQLNPDKSGMEKGILDRIKSNTLSGQAVQSRKDIQKGKKHLTPQGLIESYPEDKNEKL